MSTKAIREALDAASDMSDHPNAPVGLMALLVRAADEVAAIERAAQVLQTVTVPTDHPEREALNSACHLMQQIAENL